MKEIERIEDLTPDDLNANKHTERGTGMLERSLQDYGAGRSVLADKNGKLIAGNATVEAAAGLGIPVRVIKTDGRELVVVQRTDLDMDTDIRARELALVDNRAGQVDLEWDKNNLLDLSKAGVELGKFFFENELQDILEQKNFEPATAEDQGRLDQKAKVKCPSCGHEFEK